jgi:hypothetical protein
MDLFDDPAQSEDSVPDISTDFGRSITMPDCAWSRSQLPSRGQYSDIGIAPENLAHQLGMFVRDLVPGLNNFLPKSYIQ